MSFRIDSTGGPSALRRARKTAKRPEPADAAQAPSNLPVPAEAAARTIPDGSPRAGGDAAIHAQVIGERRGLRAGPQVHDEARGAYNSVEWSGSKDRRRPRGGTTKTEA